MESQGEGEGMSVIKSTVVENSGWVLTFFESGVVWLNSKRSNDIGFEISKEDLEDLKELLEEEDSDDTANN